MKRKQKYWGYLLGLCLMAGIAGCQRVEDAEDMEKTEDAGEKAESDEKISITAMLEEALGRRQFAEKEIPDEKMDFYYGYHTLAKEEQKVYRQLIKGLEEFQETIMVDAVPADRLEIIVNMVMTDHPEYFWTEGAFTYYEIRGWNGSVKEIKMIPVYLTDKEEAEMLKQQIEAKAAEWIGRIDPQADTYSKIKSIYETLIHEVRYEENSEQNQNIRSVFLGGSTVCMGYSKATQYLLNKMGIFCTLVTGDIVGQEPSSHAWNLVKIDEEYYYVDTTWGNPGYTEGMDNRLDIYYSYLCCNEAVLAPTHVPNDKIPLPACTDDRYHYYKNKGCWYETYDKNQIYQVLIENVTPDFHRTEFQFGSKEAYEQAVLDLVERDLIKQAIQNAPNLSAGQPVAWQVYYGGSDYLITVVWN